MITTGPLYHFTSSLYLPFILEEGLCRGDVPLSETKSANGAWLTREGRRHKQSYNRTSRYITPGGTVCQCDKAEIRLIVEPRTDPLVLPWSEVVRRLGIDPAYASWLNKAGNESGDLWFVAFRPIVPTEIVRIERDTNGNGNWREVTDPSFFPRYNIVSVSAYEFDTGRRIERVSLAAILDQLLG